LNVYLRRYTLVWTRLPPDGAVLAAAAAFHDGDDERLEFGLEAGAYTRALFSST